MANNKTKNTAAIVTDLISDTVHSLGLELWDVEYVKEGSDMYLRVTIDSPVEIDINDCERVHRAIDPILDEADPIDEPYVLEVASPGLERQLRTVNHFEACIGEKVVVKLFSALEGIPEPSSKQVTGKLKSFDSQTKDITIELDNQNIVIPWGIMSRTNVLFNFGD